MKQLSKIKGLISGIALSLVVVAGSFASTFAGPTPSSQAGSPPAGAKTVTGQQATPPFEPGTKDAVTSEKLGPTQEVTAKTGSTTAKTTLKAQSTVSAMAGNIAGVDFTTFYMYCQDNLLYATVVNTTATKKYIHVKVYALGVYHHQYIILTPGTSYSYPAFYGTSGPYTAYLYVWDGTNYVYDEVKSGTHTCNVGVTRTYNADGWVQLTIKNWGTAYATQVSAQLAPYPANDTYTGIKYDYPAPGGAALVRSFWVSTLPYGITSWTYGSTNYPNLLSGDH